MPIDAAGIGGGPFLTRRCSANNISPNVASVYKKIPDGVSFRRRKACLPIEGE